MLLSSAWAERKVLSCNISLSRQLTISSSPTLHVPIVSSFITFTFWKEISFSIQERFSFAFNLAEASFPVYLQSPTQLCALLLCQFHSRKKSFNVKSDIEEPFFMEKWHQIEPKLRLICFPKSMIFDLTIGLLLPGFLLFFFYFAFVK